jgi:hypothetical protein
MAIIAKTPKPTSATAATRGRETPPVSGRFGATLAEALAEGLADRLADGLAEALAEGVVISPPPETVTLAVISGGLALIILSAHKVRVCKRFPLPFGPRTARTKAMPSAVVLDCSCFMDSFYFGACAHRRPACVARASHKAVHSF